MNDDEHGAMKPPPAQIEAGLAQFTGTMTYSRLGLPPLLATDGVVWLCDAAACYWLVDLVASHQLEPKVGRQDFQAWTVTLDGDGADIVATDGNDHVLARQRVDWTDFPLARLTLYVEGLGSERVVLLPSEH